MLNVPRGDHGARDRGARRDLSQSLAEGVWPQLAAAGEPPASSDVVSPDSADEPMLPGGTRRDDRQRERACCDIALWKSARPGAPSSMSC